MTKKQYELCSCEESQALREEIAELKLGLITELSEIKEEIHQNPDECIWDLNEIIKSLKEETHDRSK